MIYVTFTLGIVHDMDLDKFITTCVRYYDIIHTEHLTLKIHRALPIHPFLPHPSHIP